MRLREHVLDLLAGPDIPVRYIVVKHVLLPLRPLITLSFRNDTFSHILHDLKGLLRFQSHTDQIRHDIISCADCGGNGGLLLLDQSLRITKPHIRTM